MKILAFAASTSSQSINRALVRYAASRLVNQHLAEAEIVELDLNDYEMPIYSIDREREGGIPEPAKRLHALIGSVDAVIISFAEHNGTYTAAYKNVFDWTSRVDMKLFQQRPTLMLAASPGGRAGAGVLGAATTAAPHFGAELVGSLGIGRFASSFDLDAGSLTDAEQVAALDQVLAALAARLSK